jgi:hypothetical protein
LFTDHPSAEFFVNEWPEGIQSIDADDAAIDGKIYTTYLIGEPSEGAKVPELTPPDVHQSWAGRIVVHPLADDEVVAAGGEWLMDNHAFSEKIQPLGLDEELAATVPFLYSNNLASTAIHEKVHGVQDWRLPLPILEMSAHFYEREVARAQGWYGRTIASPMERLADYYGACVAEFGEDVHRLVFGTIEPEKRAAVLTALKERCSSQEIGRLSRSEDGSSSLHWETIPVEDLKQTEAQAAA